MTFHAKDLNKALHTPSRPWSCADCGAFFYGETVQEVAEAMCAHLNHMHGTDAVAVDGEIRPRKP